MKRTTNYERNQRLNKAFALLGEGESAHRCAEILADQFSLSFRQAYRYIREAQRMERPVFVPDPTVPMTIKIPKDVAIKLRQYAQTSNLTQGEIVARAVLAFLIGERYHG